MQKRSRHLFFTHSANDAVATNPLLKTSFTSQEYINRKRDEINDDTQRKPSDKGTTPYAVVRVGKEGAEKRESLPRQPARGLEGGPTYCIPGECDVVQYEMQACLASVPSWA